MLCDLRLERGSGRSPQRKRPPTSCEAASLLGWGADALGARRGAAIRSRRRTCGLSMARSDRSTKGRPNRGLDEAARAKGRTTYLAKKSQRDKMAVPVLEKLWTSGIRSPDLIAVVLNRKGVGTGRGDRQKWTAVQVARLIGEFALDEHQNLRRKSGYAGKRARSRAAKRTSRGRTK